MLNVKEKEQAISAMVDLVNDASPKMNDKMPLLVKALANYIEKSSMGNPDLLREVEVFLDQQDSRRALQRVLTHMVLVGTSEETPTVRNYTSGQVARFFGVSISTVHYWIEQGRLRGVEKGKRYKQVRIPETAVYLAPTGAKITVAETAELYTQQQARFGRDMPMTPEEELEELRKEVAYYEQKYGGSYDETLGSRSGLTSEEERDGEQWASLIRSIERRRKPY